VKLGVGAPHQSGTASRRSVVSAGPARAGLARGAFVRRYTCARILFAYRWADFTWGIARQQEIATWYFGVAVARLVPGIPLDTRTQILTRPPIAVSRFVGLHDAPARRHRTAHRSEHALRRFLRGSAHSVILGVLLALLISGPRQSLIQSTLPTPHPPDAAITAPATSTIWLSSSSPESIPGRGKSRIQAPASHRRYLVR
jgi:hypothetical protein